MPGFFITGTGTEVGKTLVTAGLCWQLAANNHKVRALKPIMTGVDTRNWQQSDAAVLLQATGTPAKDALALKEIAPWRFVDPVSPHLAAQRTGVELSLPDLTEWCLARVAGGDTITLIEGAGGVMTPINQRETMLDLARALSLPVILVMGSYVGALSHALTALTALGARDVDVQAVIVSESANSATSLAETAQSMQQFLGGNVPVFGIPRILPGERIWQQLPNLTKVLDA